MRNPRWTDHLFFPLQFLFEQTQALLPSLFLILTLYIGKSPARTTHSINSLDRRFLFYAGIAPLLLTILISFVTGIKLRAAGGQPLLSLSGLIMIIWLRPTLTRPKLLRFIVLTFASLMMLTIAIYCFMYLYEPIPTSSNYPGKRIAADLTQEWHQKYQTPLTFVAGARWLAGNILTSIQPIGHKFTLIGIKT